MEQWGGRKGGLQSRYEVKTKRSFRKKQRYTLASSAGGEVEVGDDGGKEGIIGAREGRSSREGGFAKVVEHYGPYHDQTGISRVDDVRHD